MKKLILAFFSILLLTSCGVSEKARFQEVLDNMISRENLRQYQYVVIIPQDGCEGCITFAEEFYNSYRDDPNILFIFTNIISLKGLRNKVKLMDSTLLDRANNLGVAFPEDKQLYPCLLTLKEGEIDKVSYQSPDEDALIDLETVISPDFSN